MMKCDKKKCLLALVFLSSLLMSLKVYSNEPETNWKYVELVIHSWTAIVLVGSFLVLLVAHLVWSV